MKLVIDASVALKWVLEEDGSDLAIGLIERDELSAPDLLLIECANTLAMRVRRKLLSADDADLALSKIVAVPKRLHGSSGLVAHAQSLAIEMERSAYDCLYLALALATDTVMITADRKFAEAVDRHWAYACSIRML